MKKVDANILLRYILNDHKELSLKAKEIIDRQVVEIPIEVLCEVIYVLSGHYNIDRKSISTELKRFFNQTQCILPHREAVLRGIEYFNTISLDFVDCVLAGYKEVENDEIFTFDKKLKKTDSKNQAIQYLMTRFPLETVVYMTTRHLFVSADCADGRGRNLTEGRGSRGEEGRRKRAHNRYIEVNCAATSSSTDNAFTASVTFTALPLRR